MLSHLFEDKIATLKTLLSLALIIFLVIFFIFNYDLFFQKPEDIVEEIHAFGVWGPLLIILLIIMEVIIAPIPGSVIAIATGYAYGSILGTAICYTGNVIGTFIAFFLARHFGRKFVEKLIHSKKLAVYDNFISQEGKFIFLFAFVIPVLPPDIISFIAGFSNIKPKTFMLFVVIGYLPYMLLLNYFGSSIFESGWNTKTLLIGAGLLLMSISGLIIYFILRKKKYHDHSKEIHNEKINNI